jgi:hypothetical protein
MWTEYQLDVFVYIYGYMREWNVLFGEVIERQRSSAIVTRCR